MNARRLVFALGYAFALIALGAVVSRGAVVMGGGVEIALDVAEPNGNVYDYVRVTGASVSVTADVGQITRVVFLDDDDDLVTVEFSGPGALSLAFENISTGVTAAKYNASGASAWNPGGAVFVQGNASLTVTGSGAGTNLSVFALGSGTVIDQTLLKGDETYDGRSDLARLTIVANPVEPAGSQFGSLFVGNAEFSASSGIVGVNATNVHFTGPVFVGDIDATGTAMPTIRLGSVLQTRIAGGDLLQTNGQPVRVSGVGVLGFVDGMTASGLLLPAVENPENQGELVDLDGNAFVFGQVVVDGMNEGTLVVIDDGTAHSAGSINIAPVAGTAAMVTATHANTSVTTSGGTVIGDNGAGSLLLQAGAQYSSAQWSAVGANAGSVGLLNASGAAKFNAGETLAIGNQFGARGTVLLSGANTLLTVASNTLVGWKGTGALTVQSGAGFNGTGWVGVGADLGGEGNVIVRSGGTFQAASGLSIGNLADATGVFTHTGGNTWAQVADGATVGWQGTGTLNILDGANFNVIAKNGGGDGSLNVGGNFGTSAAPGGTVTVSGKSAATTYSSALNVAGSIDLGANGFGRLDVMETGYVQAQNLNVQHGVVNLSNAGLRIETSNPDWGIYIPQGGTLNVSNSGDFVTPHFNLDGGTANFSSFMTVDQFGPSETFAASWNIHNGATLTHAGMTFGQNAGDDVVLSINSGASVAGSEGLNFGWNGKGVAHLNSGGTLSGGQLNVGQNAGAVGELHLGWTEQPGGTATFSNVNVGAAGAGHLNVRAGVEFTSNGWTGIGTQSGGTGFINLSHGGVMHARDGLSIGNSVGAQGWVTLDHVNTVFNATRYVNVAWEGKGNLNIQNGARFNVLKADEPRDGDNGGGHLSIGGRTSSGVDHMNVGGRVSVDGTAQVGENTISSMLHVVEGISIGHEGGYGVLDLFNRGFVEANHVALHNGHIHIESEGNVAVREGGTLSIDSGTTLTLVNGYVHAPNVHSTGHIGGHGTIFGQVSSNGTMDIGQQTYPGTLRIEGNLTHDSDHHAKIDFFSGGYDRLDVTGNVTLGGTIDVQFDDGFTPVNGQTYQVLHWNGSRQGTPFVQIEPREGWTFHPLWQEHDLGIVAVSTSAAATEFDDDFADNTHWHDWTDNAALSFEDNKLYVSSTTNGTTKTWGASPPRDPALAWPNVLVGRYDAPWSASVRAHLQRGIGTRSGDEIRMQIQVTQERGGQSVQGNLANVGLMRINHPPFSNTHGVAAQAVADNQFTGNTLTLQPDTTELEEVILKMDYTAEKKLVASYAIPVESGSPEFVTIATYDPVALWGAGTASHFRVQLVGYAEGFDASQTPLHPVLPEDEAYFAEFSSTGLVPESTVIGAAQIAADNLPEIVAQPAGGAGQIGVAEGNDHTLHAFANGAGVSYQWFKDDAPIEGATANTFMIEDAVNASAGRYEVVARTEAGSVRSAPLFVHVLAATEAFPEFATRNPLPSGVSLTDVVFAAGKFVAVGVDGVVRTSTNGTTWQSTATPSSHTVLNAVTYGGTGNLYVAAGSGGDLFTWSGDPSDAWVKRTTNASDYFTDVAASPGLVVVRTGGDSVLTSEDGVTWTRHTLASGGAQGVAYGAGVFVAVGNGNRIQTSVNGIEWQTVTTPAEAGGSPLNAVAFIDNRFVAVGGNGVVLSSDTGATWTAHDSGSTNYLRSIAKVGGTWIIMDNSPRFLRSTNLTSFTSGTIPNTASTFVGAAASGTRFVAVGGGGEIVSTTNGETWQAHGTAGGVDGFYAGAFGEGKFVFAGSHGRIVTSWDGSTFQPAQNPDEGNWINGLLYDGGRFIAVAYDRVLRSDEGMTWSGSDPGATVVNTNWQGIAFNGTRYVAVGDGGAIMTSSDAVTWASASSGVSQSLQSVTGFNTGFVAVGGNGTVLNSADGLTWLAQTSPTTNFLRSVRALGGKLYAVGDAWTLLTSTDGVAWTQIALDTRGGYNVNDIGILPNGLLFTVGVQGGFNTSPDGEHWTWNTASITRGAFETIVRGEHSVVLGGRGGMLVQAYFPGSVTPQIIAAPASRTVVPGGSFTLSVEATGSGPFSYQWFRNGAPIPGATRSSLTYSNVNSERDGSYVVTVYGAGGTAQSLPATIIVGESTPVEVDGFASSANWAIDANQSRGNGWVDVMNSRLEYTTTAGGPTTEDRRDVVPSPGAGFATFNGHHVLVGRVDASWSVSVDVHVKNFTMNADSPTVPRATPGQGYRADLMVIDLHNGFYDHGLLVNAKYDATYDDRPKASISTWGNNSYRDVDATGLTEFKLAVTYSEIDHVLSAYVSADGGQHWHLQRAFDVTAAIEDGGWGVPANFPGYAFGIKLGAGSSNLVVAPGDITFDNFTHSGLEIGAFSPSLAVPPTVYGQVQSRNVAVGGSTTFSVTPHGVGPVTYQWQRDGSNLPGANGPVLTLNNVQPADAGIYRVRLTNAFGSSISQPTVLGVTTTAKVVGGSSVFDDITHPAGYIYDQVLLNSASAAITADPGQKIRVSYIDLNDDIVQVEFSGSGTLSIVLDSASGPAAPAKYNQVVQYMKGHARLVIAGADESTTLSVTAVGRANAVNQVLFRDDVVYDGIVDIAYVAISSLDGRFGALRTENASYFASNGLTGVFAPGVEMTTPPEIGDVCAFGMAKAALVFERATTVRIRGGSLAQDNATTVWLRGVASNEIVFEAGVDAHGNVLTAQANAGTFAAYNQSGIAPNSPLVGAWLLGDPAAGADENSSLVITFLPNGYYYLAHMADEPGMERGVYFWNAVTGAFSASASAPGLRDTTEIGGLTFISTLAGATMTMGADGNSLTFTLPAEQPAVLTRVRSLVNPLVGSWLLGEPGAEESSMLTLLDNGYYFMVDDGAPGENGGPGMELGTYTYAGGSLAPTGLTDTSGDWGLGNASMPLSVIGDLMTVDDEGGPLTLVRIGHFVEPAPPTITGFAPSSGAVGTAVTITGTNLGTSTTVKFGFVNASFTVNSATQITAHVPAGAGSGKIEVTTLFGAGTSTEQFVVGSVVAPAILAQPPATLEVRLGSSKSVSFAIRANPIPVVTATKDGQPTSVGTGFSWSDSSVRADGTFDIFNATLAHAGVYVLTFTNSAGSVTLDPITVIVTTEDPPTITGVSPQFAEQGETVTITGTNFDQVTGVRFDGNEAEFTVESANQITAVVPQHASSGSLSVRTATGPVIWSQTFVVGVPAAPVVVQGPPATKLLALGRSGKIEFSFTSNPRAEITFTFNAGNFSLPFSTGISSADPAAIQTGSVNIPAVTSAYAGTYVVTLSNEFGSIVLSPTEVFTQIIAAPTIASFTPLASNGGDNVVISGTDFINVTEVTFGGSSAMSFTVDSPTQITAVRPHGVTSGTITIVTEQGSGTSTMSFTTPPEAPTISGFSPIASYEGDSIVITGTGFFNVTDVTFGGVSSPSFTVDSLTQITAIRPQGVASGTITVTTAEGGVTSTASFTTPAGIPPTIAAVTPSSFAAAADVVITGADLAGATSVRFNGVPARSFTVVSSTEIHAIAPDNLTAGRVTVTTPHGTATSPHNYAVIAPTITQQPQNVAVVSGDPATFEVTATGAGSLTYQWRRFGLPISGATSRTYTIDSALLVDADYYDVVIKDGAGSIASAMARLDVAPVSYPGQLGIDPAWSVQVERKRVSINEVVPLPDGGFLVAGDFFKIGNHSTGAVARFKANGSIDTSFASPLRGSANRIAVQPDGKVLAMGSLSAETSQGLRTNLVRLNANGALDLSFTPDAKGAGSALAVAPDGKIYAALPFGADSAYRLVRLRSEDGSRDGTFVPPYPGDSYVYALQVQPSDGNVVASARLGSGTGSTSEIHRLLAVNGAFDSTFTVFKTKYVPTIALASSGKIYLVGELNSGYAAARLNFDGSLDDTFARLPATGAALTLAVESSGSVVIGGSFTAINGEARSHVARLNADGSLAAALPAGVVENDTRTLASLADGGLVVSNLLSYVGEEIPYLVRVTSAGSIDESFHPVWRAPGVINGIIRQPDGDLVIAGDFQTVGALDRSYIARLTADGVVDPDFAPDGGPNNTVQALRRAPDGSLLLAGIFTQVDGTNRPAFARLTADGFRDPGFAGEGGISAVFNDKNTLLPLPDGGMIVSADFFTEIYASGTGGIGGPLRLAPDGSHDPEFSLGVAAARVISAVLQRDGKLVTGGFPWQGTSSALMRLLPNGEIDHNYGVAQSVYSLALARDDSLWAAGGGGLFRFQPSGAAVESFAPPAGFGFNLLTPAVLIPQNDGKMIVAGSVFDPTGSISSVAAGPQMLRFNANGSLDTTFGLSGLRAGITAAVQREDGQFYVATDGALRRTKTLVAPAIVTPPTGGSVLVGAPLMLTVIANGEHLSYQWRKGGVAIPHATGPSLEFAALAAADSGNYDVVVSNRAGLQTSAIATVLTVPAIIGTPPQDATIFVGESATFSVIPSSNLTPLTYQWRRNGINIPGATGASVTLTNVPLNGGGAITVRIANSAGAVVSAPANLTVNPLAPVIVSPLTAAAIVNRGFTYQIGTNTVATFTATGLPAGLSLNGATGLITGSPTAIGSANVVLKATNVTGSDTRTMVITVNPPPPVITSPVAAGTRVNQEFTYTIAAINTPATYTATGLPPGLGLSGNVISGLPTGAGTFHVTITATNASGSVSQVVQINVQPALNAPAYSGPSHLSGTQNVAFNFAPIFTNGVTSYAVVSADGLPVGLVLDETTGVISGTPEEVGNFPITLRATGPGGVTNIGLTLVINPPATAPVVTSASTATATVGAEFSFQLTTDVPATGFVISGLPANVALVPIENILEGTPSASGTHHVQIAARNDQGTGPKSVLVLTVNHSPHAPVVTSAPVVEGRVGVAFSVAEPFTYRLQGTNSPTSFEKTAGEWPPGLTLASNENGWFVSGTPTAPGSFRVALAGTNVAGGRGPSLEILFNIRPPLNVPAITSSGTAAGRVGEPFSYAISATNSPTGFVVTDLPAWLTQNGALLSGVPTAATTTPHLISVKASNGDGTGAPKTVAITIAPAPATPIVTSATTAAGRVGLAFNYRITASEGATSFSAVDLPPGLTVDPASGIVSGTPTQAGNFVAKMSAGNNAGVGANTSFLVTIAPAPQAPTITSAASRTGKVGVAFTYQIVATPGPITTYGVTGDLPLGVSLNTSTGAFTGTPGAPGLFLVELTATNVDGTSLPQPLVININPADNVPVITSPTVAVAMVNADFTYTITATNMPGTTPFPSAITLDAVMLPAGLAVNPSTGVIQGRPTIAGSFTATLVGTNAAGIGPYRNLTIFVLPPAEAPVIISPPSAAAQVRAPFAYQIAATNNPDNFGLIDAPAWMTINAQSGAIAGEPTEPGIVTVQLVASNSAGESNPTPLTIAVAPAANTPVITSSRIASGRLGVAFSYEVRASNSPTSFLVTGLPAGLELNADTRKIEGTPQASGTFNVNISAANANGSGLPVVVVMTIESTLQLVVP